MTKKPQREPAWWTNKFLVGVMLLIAAEMTQDYFNGMKTKAVNDYRLTVAEKVLDKFESLPGRVTALENKYDHIDSRVLDLEIARLKKGDD